MKNRLLWTLVTLGLVAVFAFALWWRRDAVPPPAAIPPGKTAPGGKAPNVVPIEDRKTIDFSSGAPVVKDSAQEKAIIDRAVKEMDEAAQGVSFGPPPTTAPKKADASPATASPAP